MRQKLMTALVASSIVAAGCGGSKSNGTGAQLTRAEFTEKANAICRRVSAGYHANGYTSVRDMARKAPRVAAVERVGADDLAKLKPPAAMQADVAQMVGGLREIAADTDMLAKYAKANDLKGIAGLQAASKSLQSVLRTAKRNQLEDCARLV